MIGGYRNREEQALALSLERAGASFVYEGEKIPYREVRDHIYTPDFPITTRSGKKIYVEYKGFFRSLRNEPNIYRSIRDSNPNIDLRFVFSAAGKRLAGRRHMTHEDWCEKYGFKYAVKTVPSAWLSE